MRKCISVAVLTIAIGASVVRSADGANPNASCNGSAVSSLAGQPGVVAALTRQFHDEFKEAGVPPGLFDSAFAQEHGSVDECLST